MAPRTARKSGPARPVVPGLAVVAASLLLAGVLGVGTAGAGPLRPRSAGRPAAADKGILPPKNPAKSLQPVPDFYASCSGGALDDTVACNTAILQAVDHARSFEPLPTLRFNLQHFLRMSVPEQLFAIADLERVSRGEPPMAALTTQLDGVSHTGAADGRDPDLKGYVLSGGAQVRAWGSNYAVGTESALGADYGWMYDDGYGGFNYDCQKAGEPGCWGHRDNILGRWSNDLEYCPSGKGRLVMGAASAHGQDGASFAEIFVVACGPKPTGQVFTWAEAQADMGL